MTRHLCALLSLSLLLAGCGSSGSSPATAAPSGSPPPPSGGAVGNLSSPVVVSVNGNAGGVDIDVAKPAGASPIAQVLGVTPVNSAGGSASNTGDQMHRGTTMQVLMFGPGLSGNMQVQLSGPQDYSVSNLASIMSTDNTPGIAFNLTLNGNAALGARTIILIDSQNNVTTFSGGLEVLP